MRFDMLDIGARLRSLRIENNLSAGEVADEVGKSESHIMQIERGSRNITADMICKLAILYNTDPNTILGFGSMNFGSNERYINSQMMKSLSFMESVLRLFQH